MSTINELLKERGKTHGKYENQSMVTQRLKRIQRGCQQKYLTAFQQEAIDVIFHKIGRIVTGDPDFRDHWDDIAGYATLVSNELNERTANKGKEESKKEEQMGQGANPANLSKESCRILEEERQAVFDADHQFLYWA